jgi:hypothetical protein
LAALFVLGGGGKKLFNPRGLACVSWFLNSDCFLSLALNSLCPSRYAYRAIGDVASPYWIHSRFDGMILLAATVANVSKCLTECRTGLAASRHLAPSKLVRCNQGPGNRREQKSQIFPVKRRMVSITALVATEISCDANLRSIPNCEPRMGRTIKSPIRMISP